MRSPVVRLGLQRDALRDEAVTVKLKGGTRKNRRTNVMQPKENQHDWIYEGISKPLRQLMGRIAEAVR
jgi:hypothetical protein